MSPVTKRNHRSEGSTFMLSKIGSRRSFIVLMVMLLDTEH